MLVPLGAGLVVACVCTTVSNSLPESSTTPNSALMTLDQNPVGSREILNPISSFGADVLLDQASVLIVLLPHVAPTAQSNQVLEAMFSTE